MKACIEQIFDGNISVANIASYNSSSITVGPLINQYILGPNPEDSFVGPMPPIKANPLEVGFPRQAAGVHPIKFKSDLWWIFCIDAATAAAIRVIQKWDYNPITNSIGYGGSITVAFPTGTNHTQRGLRVLIENYTVGTVSVSGTAVTGSGTAWQTDRLSVGSRIGFGSTDPTQISTWYEISAIGSDTGITLTASAGSIAGGSDYVIQDMIIMSGNTNATITNGGLFLIKGLRPENFTQPATTNISAATTTDRIRASYWLKDASTITNTALGGAAIEDKISWTEQYAYCVDGAAANMKIFKYNIRAALSSLSAGAQVLTGGDITITGTQVVTGNISQNNNGRVATLLHGPGNGVPCLYLLTTTRIVRVPTASIVAGSTTFVADQMAEIPPGSISTNLAVGTFSYFDISNYMDRLVITCTAASGTMYITQYKSDGSQFERRFGMTTYQADSINANTAQYAFPHNNTGTMSVWIEEGIGFFTTVISTITAHAIYVYPLGADWDYTALTNNYAILPKITLGATASKLYRVLLNSVSLLGNSFFGVSPDAIRLKYRTSGIDDNSGTWNNVPLVGDMSGVSVASDIQFCAEYRTTGEVLVPGRLLSLALLYETNDGIPSQYRWNFGDFNTSNGTFAWIQSTLFGTSIGVHTINVYRADTNALVLTQDSNSTTNGDFQYWNGASWANGLGTDTVDLRRRFVPSGSLPGGVDLYATITIA